MSVQWMQPGRQRNTSGPHWRQMVSLAMPLAHNLAGDRLLAVNTAVRFHHSTFSSPAESFAVSFRPVADNAAARRK